MRYSFIKFLKAYSSTSGFWPRVRTRALRAPVFFAFIATLNGALRAPHAHRSFAASYSTPKNIYNLSNLGRQRQGFFSFHWTTEAMKYATIRPNSFVFSFFYSFPDLFFLLFSFSSLLYITDISAILRDFSRGPSLFCSIWGHN